MIDDAVFSRWVEETPAIVLDVLRAVGEGERVTYDQVRIAAPYVYDLLRDGLRPGVPRLPE